MGGNGRRRAQSSFRRDERRDPLPKTIDNDIWGTDTTFGFQSAVTSPRT